MSKTNPKIALWMLDLTTNTNIRLNNIINQLKIYDIALTSWEPSCPHEYGLIFFNEKEKLSNIRDFMIMQMRHLGRRVILCYLSALNPLRNDEIFQCYEWGIDYFLDLNIIEKYHDTIPEVINRWYKIDSIRTSHKVSRTIIGKSVALKK